MEEREGRAFIYTDPRGRRGKGGHFYIQTLRGRGGGGAFIYTDPRGRSGRGGHSHFTYLNVFSLQDFAY